MASGENRRLGGPFGKKAEEIPLAQGSTRRLVSFRHVMQRSPSSGGGPAEVSFAGVPASAALAKAVSPAALNNGQFCDNAVLSPDRTRIAYMSLSTRIRRPLPLVRNLQSDRVVRCPEVTFSPVPLGRPMAASWLWSELGSRAIDGSLAWAGWVHVFDADSGERLRKLRIGTSLEFGSAVAWSHDGRKFAAGNQDGLCEIWDAGSGSKLVSAQIHTSQVNDLAWSLDDRCIASAG